MVNVTNNNNGMGVNMSDKNIDKDLEILKEFIKKDYEPWSFYEKQGDELFELQETIENILSETNKYQEAYKIFVNLNSNLKSELETYKKIAEKLAEQWFSMADILILNGNHIHSAIEIIDWAKNEVLKDDK